MSFTKSNLVSALLLSAAAVLSPAAYGTCRHVKCSPELQNAPDRMEHVIIQYNADTNDGDAAKIANFGSASPKTQLHSIHSIAADIHSTDLETLASDPKIRRISIDHAVGSRDANVASVETALQYTVEPINAPAV